MAAETAERCYLCGSTGFEVVVASVPLVRGCLGCGLAVSEPSEETFDARYYEEDGYRAYFHRGVQWRYEAAARLRWLLSALRPRRLLEAGCAGGFFLAEAGRAGIETVGVELSPLAAAAARKAFAASVLDGRFEQVDLPDRYDAVCAFHVLEHVDAPRVFLGRARELLRPGGLLALETPNIASAAAARQGCGWSGLQPQRHRWHFAPTTLARLVEELGFEPLRLDTVFARHYRRPVERLSRAGLALTVADWRASGSPRRVHPALGDHLRLLARRA